MPARRHPAAEFPLPLLASLAAPSPTSGGGDWPPPSLGRSSLPSLPPQAGVGYAWPWTSCNGLPITENLITLRYPVIQPSAGGRGAGAPISPTPLRSGARPAFTEPL